MVIGSKGDELMQKPKPQQGFRLINYRFSSSSKQKPYRSSINKELSNGSKSNTLRSGEKLDWLEDESDEERGGGGESLGF